MGTPSEFPLPPSWDWPTHDVPGIKPGSVCNDIISNVDFAATWLDFAGVPQPSYMQGETFMPMLKSIAPRQDEWTVAYHRYWMNGDIPHNIYASATRMKLC